jgi:hypothetical protein
MFIKIVVSVVLIVLLVFPARAGETDYLVDQLDEMIVQTRVTERDFKYLISNLLLVQEKLDLPKNFIESLSNADLEVTALRKYLTSKRQDFHESCREQLKGAQDAIH